MMTEALNGRLSQVGPDKPMGQLLRRYWMPVAASADLDTHPVKAIRLLGEDLALYRDKGARYGLVDRRCPHRGTDLA